MREESQGRFEMLWDCPNCGTEKLLGITHRHCPNCGSAQDPTKRYFPPDDQKIAVENHPFQGADRVCAACDTPNAAKAVFCVNCGNPLEGAKEVRTRADQTSKESFAGENVKDAQKEAEAARQAERAKVQGTPAPSSGVAKKAGIGLATIGIGLSVLLCCGGALVFLFWQKDAALTTKSHDWTRTIAVETFTAVSDTDWREDIPAGATIGSCKPEVKDKKKVQDGEDCHQKRKDKGDGSFEMVKECSPKYREDPVYADKCSYTVNKWKETSTAKAQGVGTNPPPSWPTAAIANPGNCLGCQREGARRETYTVRFKDPAGKDYSCDMSQDKWKAIADGSRWTSKVGVLSGAVDCDALSPAR